MCVYACAVVGAAIRQAVMIKDHKSFLKVHPNTFRGQAAIEWLRGHAARALFGSEAEKEKNQQLSRSVALLLGQKLLAVGKNLSEGGMKIKRDRY